MGNIEYWLQKKTIGGWSHVTWYAELEQAQLNFAKASAGNSGYSWRLVKAESIVEKMLEKVVPIEAPEVELKAAKANVWAGQIKHISLDEAKKIFPDGLNDKDIVKFGKENKIYNNDGMINSDGNIWGFTASIKPEHGLSGRVWVINHTTKHKARVPASELDGYLAKGYERGGPRTQFK